MFFPLLTATFIFIIALDNVPPIYVHDIHYPIFGFLLYINNISDAIILLQPSSLSSTQFGMPLLFIWQSNGGSCALGILNFPLAIGFHMGLWVQELSYHLGNYPWIDVVNLSSCRILDLVLRMYQITVVIFS